MDEGRAHALDGLGGEVTASDAIRFAAAARSEALLKDGWRRRCGESFATPARAVVRLAQRSAMAENIVLAGGSATRVSMKSSGTETSCGMTVLLKSAST